MPKKYQETLDLVKKAAQEAASLGDPVRLFEILTEEFALDGLVRRLQSAWSTIPSDEIDEIVADSIEALYYKIREGGIITNAVGFIWKTAYFKSQEYHRKQGKIEKIRLEDLDEFTEITTDELSDVEEREKLRKQAVKIARSLLPKLRSANVQNVLKYVIDAVDKGLDDVSNQEISEALDLSVKTVKNCLHRGFERLSRIAQEENITTYDFDFLQEKIEWDEEESDE